MTELIAETDLPALRDAASKAHRAGDLAAAAKGYLRYLRQRPDDGGIWSNLGALYRSQQRHAMSLRAHQRAYAAAPDAPGVRNNYANILSDLGDYDLSIELRQKVLKDNPKDLTQISMIGRCLRGKGEYDEAIAYLSAAAKRHPLDAEIKLQLAFAQLGARQYGTGFRTYDIRWATAEMTQRNVSLPKWTGQALKDKTVLVLPEQGFGDAVLFTRFLPFVKAQGAKQVIYLSEKPLLRLFQGLEGADLVLRELPKGTQVDYYMNLMDMPLLTFSAKNSGSIPAPSRLNVPDDSIERAAKLVRGYEQRFKVGVVWSGSVTYKGNAFRSFTHDRFLPLTDIPNVQLFSLYKGPYLEDYEADGSSAFILDTASTDRDFADCAATMQQMDLIITSDTVTAHIAGSLGIPCWTLLHWDAFWVYRHSGATTDWYPSMRLFRQPAPLDWDGLFEQVEGALRREVSDWKKGRKNG